MTSFILWILGMLFAILVLVLELQHNPKELSEEQEDQRIYNLTSSAVGLSLGLIRFYFFICVWCYIKELKKLKPNVMMVMMENGVQYSGYYPTYPATQQYSQSGDMGGYRVENGNDTKAKPVSNLAETSKMDNVQSK